MLTEKDRAFIQDVFASPQVADAVTRACGVVDVWCRSASGAAVPQGEIDAAMTDALYLAASNGYFSAFGAMFRPMMQATVAKVQAARAASIPMDPVGEFLAVIVPAVAATLDSKGPQTFFEVGEKVRAHLRSR